MMRKIYILFFTLVWMQGVAWSQNTRSAYHLEDNALGHELNPAFQPENSYYAWPLTGNVSVAMRSSMGLEDLIYERNDGSLTTFMAKGTIAKSDLMDKIGSAFKNYSEAQVTLFGMGRRVSTERYQTLSVNLRLNEQMRIDDSMFDFMKDMENRSYDITDTKLDASVFAEIAVGESRRLNDRWTIGAKAKLLVGLAHLDMDITAMRADLQNDRWMVQGMARMNAAGFDYKTEMKDYKENGRGQYETVSGLAFDGLLPRGMGLAIDLGVSYQYDAHWTFSAAIRDLGFLSWWKIKKARNQGDRFAFDGFHNACLSDPDDQYALENPNKEPLSDQLDQLRDDLTDLAHLQEAGSGYLTQMQSPICHIGAQYKIDKWSAGALVTSGIRGDMTWVESRLNVTYTPISKLDLTLSPAYDSTAGMVVGSMIRYRFDNGIRLHLGSDACAFSYNRQLLPISLCGSIQMGMVYTIQ